MAFIPNVSFKPGGAERVQVCSRRSRVAVKSAKKGGAIVTSDDRNLVPEEEGYEEEEALALPGDPGVDVPKEEPGGKLEKPAEPKVLGIQRVVDTVETVEVETAVDPRGNAMSSPLPAPTFGSTTFVPPSPSSFLPGNQKYVSYASEDTTIGALSNGSASPSSGSKQPSTGRTSSMKDFQLAMQEERNAMLKKQRAASTPAQEPTEEEDSTTEPDDGRQPFEYRSYEYWNK